MNPYQLMLLAEKYATVREPLLAALELMEGAYLEGDLLKALQDGRAQLWPGEKSAIVTEIIDTPQTKICNFWLAGGDMDGVLKIEPQIVEWAKENGCKRLTLTGRKGWARKLRHWKEQSVMLTREI